MKYIPLLKFCIIAATVGYIASYSLNTGVAAYESYTLHRLFPDDPPPVPALTQELRFIRSEIEFEKNKLVKYQQASYEALQEAEALRARVDALKIEVKHR